MNTDIVTTQDYIKRSATYFRDKPAVVYEDRSYTFGQVNDRACRLANALAALGIKPGERIATLFRNCIEYNELMFSMIKGAFVQVTLNPRLPPAELVAQINFADVVAIIVQEHYADIVAGIKAQLPKVRHIICFDGKFEDMIDYEKMLTRARNSEPETILNMDSLGEIHYTGGSTGSPKGVMLPYRNRFAVARNILLDLFPDMDSHDRFMALQPLYHGAGWHALPVWIRGATHYIVPRFDADIALNAIEKWKITIIKTIPTVLIRLLDAPDIRNRDLKSIRTLCYGAEPMPVSKLKEAYNIFGPVFCQIYAQMEAAVSISVLKKEHYVWNDESKARQLGSVGQPMTFVQVKIVDDDGKELPPGELGEVVVQGEHIMIGYLNRPEDTAQKKRDNSIYTGDLGMKDENGFIYLTGGRKSEAIKSGGLNVFPVEVEAAIMEHPAVKEVAIIGVPDPKWGEAVKACVVLKPGHCCTEEEIIEFTKERIASYKKPQTVDFFTELPRTGAGKIAYAELRKKYKK